MSQVDKVVYDLTANANTFLAALDDAQRGKLSNQAIDIVKIRSIITLIGRADDGYAFTVDGAKNQADIGEILKTFKHGHAFTDRNVAGCNEKGAVCVDYRLTIPHFGAVQIVYNSKSGQGYIDRDKYNPYDFPGETFGHLFSEIIFKNSSTNNARPELLDRAWRARGYFH